jgi:hypothetical protein
VTLCFIDPHDAIRVMAQSLGREARRQLVGEVTHAWVDELPETELVRHYESALADLDVDDLSMLAAWHASLETVGQPLANTEFLVSIYPTLGEHRREALKVASGLRGEDAFDAGVTEEHALAKVLPQLSHGRATELAEECIEIYLWDRLGTPN